MFDEKKLARIGQKLFNRPKFWPDHFKAPDFFIDFILSPTTIMLEIGDEKGLIIVEDVVPNGYGLAHIIIFNRRHIDGLEGTLDAATKWVFATFQVAAISAWIPSPNNAAIRLVQKLQNWQFDGQIRKSVVYYGAVVDQVVYSITREDLYNGI